MVTNGIVSAEPEEISSDSVALVERAIAAYQAGKMVIMVDDADRENEGDFAMLAECITPEQVNFMAMEGRGLICVPMDGAILDRLDLPMMVQANTAPMGTAFTVSVDAASGISTGISAEDRAHTIRALADPTTTKSDLVVPGHVFPLRYNKGGVLVRAGQTESSVDLALLAGKKPVAVICEIMKPDGSMARMDYLENISEKYDIPILPIADLIAYRLLHESLVERVSSAVVPSRYGELTVSVYDNKVNGDQHVAVVVGQMDATKPVAVRVHSQCLTGDVFGSLRCECGEQLQAALSQIQKIGSGAVLYLAQEGRGIGLADKIRAYSIQDEQGLDTVQSNAALGYEPDLRRYGIGAQILRDMGVKTIELLTNNPKKVVGLKGFGLKIAKISPLNVPARRENREYLKVKRDKLGHNISDDVFKSIGTV